ncbi:hypothetical protein [Bradyrhizobium sp. BTAi1]|uniref:hypothetical protein n=1 Tax=Bradyrhizobium sp. (strain BTAi1 / ATCC BAA-1182) TaxID=288000 RepID=UPI00005DF055|nr:hypothetical protein [Bradyrhizobium sp. BTAi1]ABQ38474.1 hypothetical protein BBta_6568 [Bradyrhizobium sp. BTAi1]
MTATPQQRMQALLAKAGIPAKEIKVYGSQIVVTCHSRNAAERFAALIANFAKVRGIVESVDDVQDQAAAYARRGDAGLVKAAFTVPVWRTFAVVR